MMTAKRVSHQQIPDALAATLQKYYTMASALVKYNFIQTPFNYFSFALACDDTCATCNAPGPTGCTSCYFPRVYNQGECQSILIWLTAL